MLSDKAIKEFQEIYKKEHGKELSWEEASEAANKLLEFVKLILELEEKDRARKARLVDSPKGFHLDGDFSCGICGMSASGENSWYDKYGIKCMTCQAAVNKKIIPGSVNSNKESWYSTYDLESRFNIDRHVLKRFIKEGVLKPRIIPGPSGRAHFQLFLLKRKD